MKNKKGFTLIELMVSIVLLSIVLVFMMNTLIKLRDTNLASGVETNILVGQAIISKTINTDILSSGGISSYTCAGKTVALNLNDGTKREILLNDANNSTNVKEKTILTYNNISTNETILIRKTSNGYTYGDFSCDTISGKVIRIIITIKENSEYNSEILYYSK